MKIRKNDKTLEDFSATRIKTHIRTLAEEIEYECTDQELDYVISKLQLQELITSADIRKQLEVILLGVNRELGTRYIKVYGEKDHKASTINRKNAFIDTYIDAINPATGAKFDANANVTSKNVVTMGQELHKDDNIAQNRAILTDRITTLFSRDLASQYINDLTSHVLYKHDETATPGVPYCVAITMYPFLLDGLTKLGGESKAPTNMKSFNGEFINLLFSIASQFAGAVATPEYLMYLDYFIRKDYGQNYNQHLDDIVDLSGGGKSLRYVIENGFQQVVHSMNMPSGNRGYQCVREDTTQLSTPNGFKYLHELNEGDLCYVYKDGKLTTEPIQKLNVHDFSGELYQFKGRNYQQTVTENHRVLYKKPNTGKYAIKEAHELWNHSKLSLPIGCEGVDREEFPITDELLQLCAVTLTDGSIDGYVEGDINTGRITIYKSKNRWGYKEIPELLNATGIGFTESNITTNSFGEMVQFRIPTLESQRILRYIEHTKKQTPKFFKELSKRQIDLVIDVWSKTDGQNSKSSGLLLQCDNTVIQDQLQELVLLAGYGSEIYNTPTKKFNSEDLTETKYVKVFKRKDKRISEYNRITYEGKVWCPTTEAGIVIFREDNGIPYISGNSVFWNIGYFDKYYFEGVFENFLFPDGTAPKWETVSTLQKMFMKWFNKERTSYVMTFPVETMALLTDGKDCVDKEYADFSCEMWAEGHSFFCYTSNSVDSLSSCCRLRNEIKRDEVHNDTTHQFSMGTASIATGSKSVMTINLNRVIQDAVQADEFSTDKETAKQHIAIAIKAITERVQKYQTAFNSIIKDFYDKNMLDVYSAGFIDMKKQYLTIGVNGLTEAAEYLGIDVSNNPDYKEFVNTILETINICNKAAATKELMFNTEFVPAENLSVKNYNWDKKDGYFVSDKHIAYSSYFYNPEDDTLSVLDKFMLHGTEFVQYLDGGSACHVNLREHLSKEQYRQLLRAAVFYGTNYFTFNVQNTACNACGRVSKDTCDVCPYCGSVDLDYLTRIIGYLKRTSSFSAPRQIEEGMRDYAKV